ncbi:polysaccharide pyruvyl transferase family protein [Flammeovirga sp. EKP202]|uniref:polysaccharide pyruvyl transferase family protein n=1 Tax=Flammeovirga sp. EKP202 TaxID=2770592 RepID=UPI001CB83892|nr:polysaccharide pyruvyl transferase family protein [Flammeovirga sp. EKP202]
MLSQPAEHKLFRIEANQSISDSGIKINEKYSYQDEMYLCLSSHIKAMKKGTSSLEPFFWIAEDDVVLPSESDLALLLKEKPEDAEVIQCCAISNYAVSRGKEELKKGNLFFEWVNAYKSTAFYGITREAALKFIDKFGDFDFSETEKIYPDFLIYDELKTYTTSYPFAVTDTTFDSDIVHKIREGFISPTLQAIEFQEKGRVLVDLFKLKGKKVYYIQNIGNAGDALINQSTFDYFELIGLDYEVINWYDARNLKEEIIIYGGGGSLVRYYSHCKRALEGIIHCNQMILLPCTVEGHEDFLRSAGSNLTIYCRERISYDYLKKINHKINVFMSEDMALRYESNAFTKANSKKVLKVFREGVEGISRKPCNDISVTLNNADWWRSANCKSVVDSFFNYINEYQEVHTNRLHVAIAASLLDKEVTLYDGSYYKNRAVYEFSLSNNPKIKIEDGYKKSSSTTVC